MFVGKAGAYPNKAPFSFSTLEEALDLPANIRQRDIDSTLLQKFVIYGYKKLYSTCPFLYRRQAYLKNYRKILVRNFAITIS
jgi:hypothetical protein